MTHAFVRRFEVTFLTKPSGDKGRWRVIVRTVRWNKPGRHVPRKAVFFSRWLPMDNALAVALAGCEKIQQAAKHLSKRLHGAKVDWAPLEYFDYLEVPADPRLSALSEYACEVTPSVRDASGASPSPTKRVTRGRRESTRQTRSPAGPA